MPPQCSDSPTSVTVPWALNWESDWSGIGTAPSEFGAPDVRIRRSKAPHNFAP